jgi:type VI secretion system protein ImpE
MSLAEEHLKSGDLDQSLKALQDQIRSEPADPKLRIFLFQLLCVFGQWKRAMTQLNVIEEMDPGSMLMTHMCRPALNCEVLRLDIFDGKRTPLVFGEPSEWIGSLIQANKLSVEKKYQEASELRNKAYDQAPATEGSINGEPFEWICDADSRLGPMLEAIIDGKYYWVPFSAISEINIEPPADLRDMIWACATFTWVNEGTACGLIPVRYPGSHEGEDVVKLSRKTDWTEEPGQLYLGSGQRVLATNAGEYSLLEVLQIKFDVEEDLAGDTGATDV